MMKLFVEFLNRLLTATFDLLFRLLAPLPDLLSLTILSLAAGVLMVWVFGRVSRQERIRKVRDGIQANLIAIRLFQGSAGVFLRSQGRVFLGTLAYLRLSLKPMLVMILPLLAVVIQLHGRYGLRPFEVGEAFLVTAVVSDGSVLASPGSVRLEAGGGLEVETPGVRVPALREVSWRLRPRAEGVHTVTVRIGGREVRKEVAVGGSPSILTVLRTARAFPEGLLHPGERPLGSDSPLRSVEVSYSGLDLDLLGWRVHWLLIFFVLSVASGYLVKGFMGVHI